MTFRNNAQLTIHHQFTDWDITGIINKFKNLLK